MKIRDLNEASLEGTVVDNPVLVDANDKRALNFVVESRVYTDGEERYYRHGCVLWGDLIDRYEKYIRNGIFLRMKGHLQSGILSYVDNGIAKTLYYDKINVKFLEADA